MTNWQRKIMGFGPLMDKLYDRAITPDEWGTSAATILMEDPAYKTDDDFELLVEEIGSVGPNDPESYIDNLMTELYDWADDNRVWIDPID